MKRISLFVGILMLLAAVHLWAGGSQDTTGRGGAYSGQGGGAQSTPAWVLQPPPPDAKNTYFVATGNDPSNDEAKAIDAAGLDLIDQINRYLGVSITSETSAEELAANDSYQTSVASVVTQKASGTVAGFRIADRFISRNNRGVTVQLLGEYNTAELEKEKSKRAALIAEKEDAVAAPENKGKAAEGSGALFDALRSYLEAAATASGSDIRNADVKFERNIQNALRVISRMKLDKVSGPTLAAVKQAFTQDFIVSVSDSQGNAGVSGAQLLASFREVQDNGRSRIRNTPIKTSDDGTGSVHLPDPTGVGSEKLTVALDASEFMHPFENLNGRFRTLADSVQDALNGKRVVFDYSVQSSARQVSTGVLVLELNQQGQANGTNQGQQGVQQKLTAAGFKLANLTLGPNFLLGKSDNEIVALVKDISAGKADRIIFGNIQVQNIDNRGADGVFASVTGTVTVVDVKSGTILLSVTKLVNARGNDQARAISAAFLKAGQDIGDQLTRDMP